MKALILAAGSGSRLLPLTAETPKPLLPVCGRPLLEHTIELLRDQGIVEIAINLHHAGELIERELGDGSRFGVRLRYSHETELLGTAGAMRPLRSFLDETFVVVYGDVLTTMRLQPLIDGHRRRGATLSLALWPSDTPTAVGLVETAADGRVTRFVEKPAADEVFTNLSNSGVLVCEPSALDRLPDRGPADFGCDLIPALLEEGATIWSRPLDRGEYLIDIGTPASYLRAQTEWAALLHGRRRGSTTRPATDRPVPAPTAGLVDDYLERLADVVSAMPREAIADVTALLIRAWREERTVVVMGNGGSAATASHMVNDLRKLTICDGWPRLRALSLNDNVPLLTAWANDAAFEDCFAEPLRGLVGGGDVVIGISTSGNSANVLQALRVAHDAGAVTVGFSGREGGALRELVDHLVRVPSDHIGRQEDCHQVLDHVIANTMRQLAASGGGRDAAAAIEPIGEYLLRLEQAIRELPRSPIAEVIGALLTAWAERRTVYLMGNGGSAATAAHMVNDLTKLTITPGWPRLRATSLADNVPLLTAWGNDSSYDLVFAEPLRDRVEPGDVVIGISTSGTSANVVEAVRVANAAGATTIGFTGREGGSLPDLVDIAVRVPSDHIGRQEDCHLFLDHVIANVLRDLARREPNRARGAA